ncbi:MAG: hypothetical protein ACXWUG_14110 [Polyangiales bacterium]
MMRALGALVVTTSIGCSSQPKVVTPKHQLPPLETSSLPAITQGPGAKWALVLMPKAIYSGPLSAPMNKLVPKEGMDTLATRLGFDLRGARDAWMVGYTATTFYAVHLPEGVGPSGVLDSFDKRLITPKGKSNPQPDLARVWGTLAAGTRASAAGMWSSKGDVVVGEGGRLGPVIASMALATGKLSKERSLASDKTFGPLLAWASGAEIALFARCPLAEAMGTGGAAAKEDNALVTECFGAGVTLRPSKGKLLVSVRVTGLWGKDAGSASDALRATFARLSESDLGRSLGFRDAVVSVKGTPEFVDGEVTVDPEVLAAGLRRLLDSEISAATVSAPK